MKSKWERLRELVFGALTGLVGLAIVALMFYGLFRGGLAILRVINVNVGDLLGKLLIAVVGAGAAFLAAVVIQELKRSIEVRACVRKVAVLGRAIDMITAKAHESSLLINASVGTFLFTDDDLRNIVKYVTSDVSLELMRVVFALKMISERSDSGIRATHPSDEELFILLRSFKARNLQDRLIADVYFPPGDLLPLDHLVEKVEKL